MDAFAIATDGSVSVGWTGKIGAFCFGFVIGWNLYYLNRYRSDKIGIQDIGRLISAIGGGAVLALFSAGSMLFGYYAIGLAVGFFAYLIVLLILTGRARGFTAAFFLDGRVPVVDKKERLSRQRPLTGATVEDEEFRT